MPKESENVHVYDAQTAQMVPAGEEHADAVAMHEAIVAGGPLPSDRTAEELEAAEPAAVGPVVTSGPPAASSATAPATGGTAGTGTTRTGSSGSSGSSR